MKRILVALVVVASFGIWAAGAASASAVPGSHAARTLQPGGPVVRARSVPGSTQLPTISLNWSGYADTSSRPFTYVHASFVQPKISCPGTSPNQWTSNWAGLDGFTNATVEQDGTFGYCAGTKHTTPVYVAWYEMFPAASVNVFVVHPGDQISATVRYTGGKFVLTIADLTLGKSVTKVATCATCQRASAEWIIERPAVCTNKSCTKAFITQLADFHTSQLQGQAQVAGGKVKGIQGFVNYPIYMVSVLKKGFISLDTVGPVAKSAFTAIWDRAGSIYPITL
jgi:hypothetical protein